VAYLCDERVGVLEDDARALALYEISARAGMHQVHAECRRNACKGRWRRHANSGPEQAIGEGAGRSRWHLTTTCDEQDHDKVHAPDAVLVMLR
jgi:hypothetical protein